MKKFIALVLILASVTAVVSSCAGKTSPSVSSDATSENISSSNDETASSREEISDNESSSAGDESDTSVNEESSAESSAEPSTEQSREESSEEISEETPSETSDYPEIFEQEGILIVGTMGMEKFYGSDVSGLKYSQCVQNIKAALGSGVAVYSMVAPHASVFYAPKNKYSSLLSTGKDRHDFLKANAGEDVVYVDAYGALSKHTDEPLYYRTEHHWAALGAYYAAKEFARLAGADFPDISEYEEHINPGFVGSLYNFSGKAQILKDNPDDLVYYLNKNVALTAYYCDEGNFDFANYDFKRDTVVYDRANYSAFLGGDGYGIKIVTNNHTGRTLVVLKDSYGNAVMPFLLSSFDTIYVLDYRYYQRNCCDFANDVGATDVLVIASGFTACGTIWKKLEAMRTMN